MKKNLPNLSVLILLLVVFSGSRAIGQTWQSIPMVTQQTLDAGHTGGEGGQIMHAIVADHTNGSFMLMGTDVGGIYRSVNGGLKWEPCNVGYHPRGNAGFAIDPFNNQRAIAVGANSTTNSSHGLYLTVNQGGSWQHVQQEGGYTGYRAFKDKIAFDRSSFDSGLGYTRTAYWSNPAGGLFRTTNGGSSWQKINNDYGDCILDVSPNGAVYIGSNTGFSKSIDGGVNFTQTFTGDVRDISVISSEPMRVWISTPDKLYVSDNGGDSFTQMTTSGYPGNVVTFSVSPSNKNHMVLCHKASQYNNPVYYSQNGGLTWQVGSRNNTHAFLPFNGRVQKFAWHPLIENRVWALGADWITSSHDGGKNLAWDANGYTGILVGGFFNFNVFNPDILFLGSQDYNGAFTKDGGRSWKYANASGVGWGGFTYGAYALNENIMVTMVAPDWGQPGPLSISKNGANSFTRITEIVCSGLQVGCGDVKNPDVIYFREYYSKDKGETWNVMNGCRGVLIANLYGQKEVYGGNGNAVVTSKDLGDTWETVVGMPDAVEDIAVDHMNNKLFIVTKNHRLFTFENNQLNEISSSIPLDQYSNRSIRSVAVDPHDTRIVYTSGTRNVYKTDAAVSRSKDGGITWEIITPNNRTNTGFGNIDGANEVSAIRVHPGTRDLWAKGGCYGVWKLLSEYTMKIQIESPQEGSTVINPAPVTLTAAITGNENPIQKVEFYSDSGKIGEATEAPFTFNLDNAEMGYYDIYAIAFDNLGNTSVSNRIQFTVCKYDESGTDLICPDDHMHVPVTGVTLDMDSLIVSVGSTHTLVANIIPIWASNKAVSWSSDNTGVAEVNQDGTITAKSEGNAIIRISTEDGNFTADILIKVILQYQEDFMDNLAQDWVLTQRFLLSTGKLSTTHTAASCLGFYDRLGFYSPYTYTIEFLGSGTAGAARTMILFNYQDNNNYYFVEFTGNGNVSLKKKVNGVISEISVYGTYSTSTTLIQLEINYSNQMISVTATKGNEQTVLFDQVQDASLASGKIGVETTYNNVHFSKIKVSYENSFISSVKKEFSANQINIYPNPSSRFEFSIELPRYPGIKSMEIYNMLGELLYKQELDGEGEIFHINTGKAGRAGLYLVKIEGKFGVVTQKLLIK